MSRIRFLCLFLALFFLTGTVGAAFAAQVDCDSTYCFSAEDFSPDANLEGVCITGLPDAAAGTVLLGHRVIRPGDILTIDQLDQMTFAPLRTETNTEATVSYLPVYADRVEEGAELTISIRGKKDHAPIAEDLAVETYKNLPTQGQLKVHDPEGQPMTFSVVRQPKRGLVSVESNGSFTYTPKKNKVGVDSFTYTAVDPAGNVSREATVTVQILKPTDSQLYTDHRGHRSLNHLNIGGGFLHIILSHFAEQPVTGNHKGCFTYHQVVLCLSMGEVHSTVSTIIQLHQRLYGLKCL